jgi:hypothetical protein
LIPIAYAVGIALFLWAVGLDGESLPFPRNSDFSDAVLNHWPNAVFHRDYLVKGVIDNPFIMNGTPFAPNPLNKVWYPFQWLVLMIPPTLHLNVMLWGHLTLAGIGMYVLGRRLGVSHGVAGFMGAVYAFTPRMIAAAGAGHLDVVYAAGWFPWLLWAVRIEKTFARIGILGILLGISLLADIRITNLALICVLVTLFLFLKRDIKTFALQLIAITLIAVLITSPLWIGLWGEWGRLSRSALTLTDAAAYSLNPLQLIGLWVGQQNGNHEFTLTLGFGVLALAGFGVRYHFKESRVWLGLAVFGWLYALGEYFLFWQLLVRVFPQLLVLRVPARAWWIVVIALIPVAGYGLQTLTSPPPQLRRFLNRWIAFLALTSGGCAVMFFLFIDRGSGFTGALMIGLTLGMLFLARSSPRWRAVRIWVALLMIDLFFLNVTLIEGVNQSEWLGVYSPLAAVLKADQVDFVYSPTYSFPQQAAIYYQIPIIGGVDPFQYTEYVQRFKEATGTQWKGYSVTLPPLEGETIATSNREAVMNAEKLTALRVSHILSAYPIEQPKFALLIYTQGVYIYRNTVYAPPR